jgi:hypothetical protein
MNEARPHPSRGFEPLHRYNPCKHWCFLRFYPLQKGLQTICEGVTTLRSPIRIFQRRDAKDAEIPKSYSERGQRLARIDEQHIIGHEREQAGEIAGVNGVDPC